MYDRLVNIALTEYSDVIARAQTLGRRSAIALKLRLFVRDGTFIDIWVSPDHTRYSYHWEQRAQRGLIHRHDNAPDHPEIETFPKHLHDGAESTVVSSDISDGPPTALRQILNFVRLRLSP